MADITRAKQERLKQESVKSWKISEDLIQKDPEKLERKTCTRCVRRYRGALGQNQIQTVAERDEHRAVPSRGSLIADVGCGNGKNIPDCDKIGGSISCDFSMGLLKICASRGYEVLAANALNLPYRDNTFDAAICIAVLHHISTKVRRQKLVSEVVRILRRDGVALFYAWAKNRRVVRLVTDLQLKDDGSRFTC